MKRLILFSFCLMMTMMSRAIWLESADFRVVCKDGSVTYFCGMGTDITFNEDGTILYIQTEWQNNVISYAVDGIEAIEFTRPGELYDSYDYVGAHIDVDFSATDDSSFSEVEEEIVTNKEHDDYGDFIEHYNEPREVVITYKEGGKATCTGKPSGVTVIVSGNHVVVTSSNDKNNIAYTLKGATANGSFKLYSLKKAQINLNGVSIINPTGPAINIQSGKTMLVNVADGTTNYLEDSEDEYQFTDQENETSEQKKGTFFSEGQLIFSGNGTLNVKSNYGHGIASDDYVRMRADNMNITIDAVRDGISTKERFIMYGGELTINAGQDGIDVGEGYIEIGAGKLTVNAADEGITASYEGDEDTGVVDPLITPYIDIKGGLIKVTTTGDKGHGIRAMSALSMSGGIVQVVTKGAGSKALMAEGDMSLTGGKVTACTEGNALYEADVNDLSSSAAIRSKGTLTITDMTIGAKCIGTGSKGINNVGDIVMTNSRVTVVSSGGTHKQNGLDSRSRGVTSDGGLTIDGGSLLVRSYEEPLYLRGAHTFLNNAVYSGYQVGK